MIGKLGSHLVWAKDFHVWVASADALHLLGITVVIVLMCDDDRDHILHAAHRFGIGAGVDDEALPVFLEFEAGMTVLGDSHCPRILRPSKELISNGTCA